MLTLEQEREKLREAYGVGWTIWWTHPNGTGEPAAWMAARTLEEAGLDPTIVADSANQLCRELQQQSLLAHIVRQLIAALQARQVLAAPIGGRAVEAAHPVTTGRVAVVLSYIHEGKLGWFWTADYEPKVIGPVDEVGAVADEIVNAISGRAGRP